MGAKVDGRTDGRTDGQTDGRTDLLLCGGNLVQRHPKHLHGLNVLFLSEIDVAHIHPEAPGVRVLGPSSEFMD